MAQSALAPPLPTKIVFCGSVFFSLDYFTSCIYIIYTQFTFLRWEGAFQLKLCEPLHVIPIGDRALLRDSLEKLPQVVITPLIFKEYKGFINNMLRSRDFLCFAVFSFAAYVLSFCYKHLFRGPRNYDRGISIDKGNFEIASQSELFSFVQAIKKR